MADHHRIGKLAALTRAIAKLPETTPVTTESRFVEDLGIDSLDLVALFLETQDRFGVTIDEDRIQSIRTVGDLLRLVADAPGSQAA